MTTPLSDASPLADAAWQDQGSDPGYDDVLIRLVAAVERVGHHLDRVAQLIEAGHTRPRDAHCQRCCDDR